MARPFPLYHWAPVSRRKSILREGLLPRKWSRARDWKPPYLCFADSPSWAWALSGDLYDRKRRWDLWQVWSNVPTKLRRRKDGGKTVIEYRVFESIPKRHVWHVGTRLSRQQLKASLL